MTQYAADAAGAYADLLAAGQAVTFTKQVPGTVDPATNRLSGASTVAVAGAAVRAKGNLLQYQALELVVTEAATLLFAPQTVGQLPPLGASVAFGGVTYVVRYIDPVAPDGTALLSRIVVSR